MLKQFILLALWITVVGCRTSMPSADPASLPTTPTTASSLPLSSTPTITSNLIPSPSPILPSETKQPSLTPPANTTADPLSELVDTPPINATSDAKRFKEIISKGMADISLFPRVAEIMVTDAQGRHLGYDPLSSNTINEFIDGESNFSSYTYHEDQGSSEILLLPLQAWGETITVTVTGVDTGEYTLFTTFGDGLDAASYVYTGTITSGQIKTVAIDIPENFIEFPSPPQVDGGSDISASRGQLVIFTGSFTDINPDDTHQIDWDFGDGAHASETLTPSHTYATPGVYRVTLSVTDSYGFTITDTLRVTIN